MLGSKPPRQGLGMLRARLRQALGSELYISSRAMHVQQPAVLLCLNRPDADILDVALDAN